MLSVETVSVSIEYTPSKHFDVEYTVCCSNAETLRNSFNLKAGSVLTHSCYLHDCIKMNQNIFLISVQNNFQNCLLLDILTISCSFGLTLQVTVHQMLPGLLCSVSALITAGDLGNGKNKITNKFIRFPLVWKIYLLFLFTPFCRVDFEIFRFASLTCCWENSAVCVKKRD